MNHSTLSLLPVGSLPYCLLSPPMSLGLPFLDTPLPFSLQCTPLPYPGPETSGAPSPLQPLAPPTSLPSLCCGQTLAGSSHGLAWGSLQDWKMLC